MLKCMPFVLTSAEYRFCLNTFFKNCNISLPFARLSCEQTDYIVNNYNYDLYNLYSRACK